jgi:hypothetical protein
VNPVEVVAEPGIDTAIRFTLSTPPDAPPGGYRSAILFEFLPATATPEQMARGVAFRSRIATIIYVTVGVTAPAAELLDLQPQLQAGRPPAVVATLRNTGRVHVRTRGHAVVYDRDRHVVRRLSLPDVPVLPDGTRDVVVPLIDQAQPDPLAPGQYRVEVRIDIGMPELLVGETTITIGS